jgi:hypothetical protein
MCLNACDLDLPTRAGNPRLVLYLYVAVMLAKAKICCFASSDEFQLKKMDVFSLFNC